MKVMHILKTVSLLLMAAMLFMVSGVVSLHNHEHTHEHSVSHTLEDEADACHRSIYHGDITLGCQHKSHVHNAETDCQLCDLINHRVDQDLVQIGSFSLCSVYSEGCSAVLLPRSFRTEYEHGQRGPPQV